MTELESRINGMLGWNATTSQNEVREAIRFLQANVERCLFTELPNNNGDDDHVNAWDLAAVRRRETGIMDPESALLALKEPLRTGKILRAIQAASCRREIREVLEGGCGPVPILSLAAAVFAPHAHITAVEGNPISFRAATEIVLRYGMQDRISVILADCRTRIEALGKQNVDLVISETFSSGMREEQGIQIMTGLMRHHGEAAIAIPECISVGFTVLESEQMGTGCPLEFAVRHQISFRAEQADVISPISARLSCAGMVAGKEYVVVGTTEVAFDEQNTLAYPEKSGITRPIVIARFRAEITPNPGDFITISYVPGSAEVTSNCGDCIRRLPD